MQLRMRGLSLGRVGAVIGAIVAVLVAQGSAAAKKPKAELVVTAVGSPPATLAAGDRLTVSDTVKNKRRRAKRSENAYLLSSDKFRDSKDVELTGSRSVPKLKRGRKSKGTAELTVPNSIRSGEYRLLVCADATERVRERSESNNCTSSKEHVRVSDNSSPNGSPPDTTAPATPVITDTDPNPPSSNNSPEVKGDGAEAGSRVRIYSTQNCGGSAIGSGSAGAFNAGEGITADVANNQTTNLRATATDDAGNRSGCSAPFAYTHDSAPPAAPTIAATSPTSPSSDNNPSVIGGAAAGSTVRIYAGTCSGSPLGTDTAAVFGGAGITVLVDSDSTTQLRATATDAAGNVSNCSAAFAYTEDSTAPAAPTLTGTSPPTPPPADENNPEVIGTAEAGSTVRIYSGLLPCMGTPIEGSAAQLAAPGITITVPDNSATTLTADITDAAGNGSPCSTSIIYLEVSGP